MRISYAHGTGPMSICLWDQSHEHMLMVAYGTSPMSICVWDPSHKHMLLGLVPRALLPSSRCRIRIGYVPSILMGPKPIESEECTESDLLCHLIHGLYPVGIMQSLL